MIKAANCRILIVVVRPVMRKHHLSLIKKVKDMMLQILNMSTSLPTHKTQVAIVTMTMS